MNPASISGRIKRGHENPGQISAKVRMSLHDVLLSWRARCPRFTAFTGNREAMESYAGKLTPHHDQPRQQRTIKPDPARSRRPLLRCSCSSSRFEALAGHRSRAGSASAINGRHRLLEQLFHAGLFECIHGVIPCLSRSFLSKRSARNTRSFTAVTEMPSASATSL